MKTAGNKGSTFPHLFSPGAIGGLELRNRIVMTPMGTNQERTDGHLGEAILRYYEARARGGAAMVIAGVASIMWPQGASNPNQAAISDDAFLSDWRELAARIHAQGAAVAVQLHHGSKVAVQDIAAGRPLWVPSLRPMKPSDLYDNLTPDEMKDATSALVAPGAKLAFHEMTHADIATVVRRYADAACRAKKAGIDAVELHAGHGYMLQAFLSPASNLREDAYGGPIESRARMLVETIHAVRERVGEDFPLWCRIDGAELGIEGGICEEDARRAAEIAVDAGVDAVHVSAYAEPTQAAAFTVAPLVHEPAGYLPMAAGIKSRVSVPVIAVGRIEPERAEQALAKNEADFIAMGRKLLADPELPNKLRSGHRDRGRPCVYSYACVGNVFLRRASRCTVNPWMGREGDSDIELKPASVARRVAVVGGGPAGLEAARVAALRGHRVQLFERSSELGGLANIAARLSADTRRWIDYLVAEVRSLDIDVRLDCPVTPEMLATLTVDALVIAVGGEREEPRLRGAETAGAPQVIFVSGLADLIDQDLAGRNVAVLGDDLIALSVADHIADHGGRVSLIGEGADWAPEMAPPRRWRLLHRLQKSGATLLRNAGCEELESGGLLVADAESRRVVEADTVLVVERAKASAAVESLAACCAEVYRVGDANGARYLQEGLLESARAGAAI